MSADEIARALGPLHVPSELDDRYQELSELSEEMLERRWSAADVAETMKPLSGLAAGAGRDPQNAASFAALLPIVTDMIEHRSPPYEVQKVIADFLGRQPEASAQRSFLPPRADRPG
jgi:hypothetical protein